VTLAAPDARGPKLLAASTCPALHRNHVIESGVCGASPADFTMLDSRETPRRLGTTICDWA